MITDDDRKAYDAAFAAAVAAWRGEGSPDFLTACHFFGLGCAAGAEMMNQKLNGMVDRAGPPARITLHGPGKE